MEIILKLCQRWWEGRKGGHGHLVGRKGPPCFNWKKRTWSQWSFYCCNFWKGKKKEIYSKKKISNLTISLDCARKK